MIDITCPRCETIYHADENHIGRAFRCKVCGKVLLVERQALRPSVPRQARGVTVPAEGRSSARPSADSKAREGSRHPRFGVGILVGVAIFLALWLWLRGPQPEPKESSRLPVTKQGPSTTLTTVSVPVIASPAEAKEKEIIQRDAGRLEDPELINSYREVNERFYESSLPKIPVFWEPRLKEVGSLKAAGLVEKGLWAQYDGKFFILLNPQIRKDPREIRRVLCHEIVHEYLFTLGDTKTNHGPAFKRGLLRLAEAGAFEGISTSEGEKARLRSWIDGESARLAGESARIKGEENELDQTKEEIERERASLDRELRDLNQRISIGNEQGYGWPSDGEIESSKAKGRLLDQGVDDFNGRVVDFKARVARYNGDVTRFNLYVNRYNLMMAYPDGLDEESEIQPKSAVNQRR